MNIAMSGITAMNIAILIEDTCNIYCSPDKLQLIRRIISYFTQDHYLMI